MADLSPDKSLPEAGWYLKHPDATKSGPFDTAANAWRHLYGRWQATLEEMKRHEEAGWSVVWLAPSAEGRITPFGPDLSKLAPEHRAEIERFQRSLDEDDAPGPAAWLRKYAGTVNDPDVNVRLSMAADEIDRLMAAQSHVATTCEHGQAKECEQCFDLASPINAASQSTGCTIAAGKSASATGERADAHLPASAAPSSTGTTSEPPCVAAGVYTLGEHNGWTRARPNPWPCPACRALEHKAALSANASSTATITDQERLALVERLQRAASNLFDADMLTDCETVREAARQLLCVPSATAPTGVELARFVIDHPHAANGMGDKLHSEWLTMRRLAEDVLRRADGKASHE